MVDLVYIQLSSDETAPAAIRAAVNEVRELNGVRDDVKLIATELVTNAILHSAEPSNTMEFRLSRSTDTLLISVHEHGPSLDPARASILDLPVPGALGWWIVQRMARRCGSERLDGLHVWAELPLDRER
jgi:anti-sigma regulatory factor (Ser/Thr protein kinase)